jgi:YD repeat-containing protein
VEFQLHQFGRPIGAVGIGSTVSAGGTSSWHVPDGLLQNGQTYQWSARSVDASNHSSQWTAQISNTNVTSAATNAFAPGAASSSSAYNYWDFTLSVSGMAAKGAPCEPNPCYLTVAAYYKKEDLLHNVTPSPTAASNSPFAKGTDTLMQPYIDENINPIATHLRVEVQFYCQIPGLGACPEETSFVEWIKLPVTKGQCLGVAEDGVCPAETQGDPVNSATGNYATQIDDLALPGIGLPFRFTRFYNSLDDQAGPLGRGWTHSYAASLQIQQNGDLIELRGGSGQQVVYRSHNGAYEADSSVRSELAVITGGYELTRNDQTVLTFNAQGRLILVRDRNGNDLDLTYSNDVLSSITDTVGRTINFTYTDGRLARVALADGRDVEFSYENGLLRHVTDVRGGSIEYTYDAGNRLKKIVDQNLNTVVDNTYGTNGRVIQQADARGKVTLFSWDATTQTSTMTDARGNTWKDVYDNGKLVERITPCADQSSPSCVNAKTKFTYDDDLNLESVTDPRGSSVWMTYDASGNLLTRTGPAPLFYRETWTYNSRNDVVSYENGRAKATTFGYDTNGNLTSVDPPGTTPATVYTRLTSDPALVDYVTDGRGKVTDFGYDADGNLTEIIRPRSGTETHKTTMGYDSAGRMTSLVEATGNEPGATPTDYDWIYTYDAANNLKTVTDPLGNPTEWSYDPAGNLDWVKDAKLKTTDYVYNAANLLTHVDPPGLDVGATI